MSLRDRKKGRTSKAILAAARRLFVRNGFDATRMEAIATKAQVAPGTLYNYFPSKSRILLALFAQASAATEAEAAAFLSDNDGAAVELIAGVLFRYADIATHFPRPLLQEALAQSFRLPPVEAAELMGLDFHRIAELGNLLAELRRRGKLGGQFEIPQACIALYGLAMNQLLLFVHTATMTPDMLAAAIRAQVELVFAGLRP